MADKKISALTSATTPLAGTEVLPIVQSGATVKVAVSDLTAGRAISATAVTASTGDITSTAGNFVVGTSGKGVDFAATPGTGTSELLADYEEGTWTPNQGAGLVLVGAFSSSGTYIKVGNVVTVQAKLIGATSISWASGAAALFTNLPFTAAGGREFTGAGHNSGYTTSYSVITAGTNTVFSIEAQVAVANVSITITYFV